MVVFRVLSRQNSYRKYAQSAKGKARFKRYAGTAKGRRALRRAGQRYAKAHPDLMVAKVMKREARKRGALVVGAEAAIKAIYDRANWLRSQGWDVEVDHIFPLGFGWHEPANLQIIFASDNIRKNCGFDFAPEAVFV